MSRQLKRCFMISVGGHMVLLALLLYGPESSDADHSKIMETPPLHLVRPEVLDSGATGGKGNPQPSEEPTQAPASPEPKPSSEQSTQKQPSPKPAQEAPPEQTEPPPEEPKPAPIKPNLTQTSRRYSSSTPEPEPELKRVSREPQGSSEIEEAIEELEKGLSSSTEINFESSGGAAGANYASYVKATYERAWYPPGQVDAQQSIVEIEVTVASNGRVETARIRKASGIGAFDQSVRRALDRVKEIKSFPAGIEEERKTYVIQFNLRSNSL